MNEMMSFKFKFPKLKYDDKKLNTIKIKELKKISLPKNKNVNSVASVARGPSPKFKKLLNERPVRRVGHVSSTGATRIKQQKGLKPWGDFDGDKLINMLDCNPRDRTKQGPRHTIEDKLNPSDDLRDNQEVPQANIVKEPERKGRFAEFRERRQAVSDERAELSQRRKANEQDLLVKAQRQARADTEKRRIAQLRRAIKEREADTRTPGQKERAKAGKAFGAIGGAFTTISGAARSTGGFGINQQALAPVQGTLTKQQRILQVLGKLPPEQAQQAQAPSQSCGDAVRDVQSDPGQGVFSPNSKRVVRYVRGKYKK